MTTNGIISGAGLLAVAWLPGLESWVQMGASGAGVSLLVWQVCFLHKQLQQEREESRKVMQALVDKCTKCEFREYSREMQRSGKEKKSGG